MKDDKLAGKIQELPETRILQLEGEILNLKREIAGLEGYRRDYQSACMELDLFRGDGRYLYNEATNIVYTTQYAMKQYFNMLLKAAKLIPKKHKRKRGKIAKILKKARTKYNNIANKQMDILYEWKNRPLYKFD